MTCDTDRVSLSARCALLLGLGACYRPSSEPSCTVACTTTCPSGLVCGSDGFCHAAGSSPCSEPPFDGPEQTDGGLEVCAGTGTGYLTLCYALPDVPFDVATSMSIDTDEDTACTFVHHDGQRAMCVLAGISISVNANLNATGARPLVLWSASTIKVAAGATIDAASRNISRLGAGGNALECAPVAGQPATSTDRGGGGGGGAGGSRATVGGNGGPSPTIEGATASPPLVSPTFHGGCAGGAGGAQDMTAGGKGGHGGGAVYLAAATSIQLDGKINASGGGGTAASRSTGGGGGGSGGMIVLDAPEVALGNNAVLMAVGGSGSTGGSSEAGGVAGTNASFTSYATAVVGPGTAGDGGAGSNPTTAASGTAGETGNTVNGGGGGGGGGAGENRVFGTITGTGFDMRPPIVN